MYIKVPSRIVCKNESMVILLTLPIDFGEIKNATIETSGFYNFETQCGSGLWKPSIKTHLEDI